LPLFEYSFFDKPLKANLGLRLFNNKRGKTKEKRKKKKGRTTRIQDVKIQDAGDGQRPSLHSRNPRNP